jgi:hypothetical protein
VTGTPCAGVQWVDVAREAAKLGEFLDNISTHHAPSVGLLGDAANLGNVLDKANVCGARGGH